MKTFLLLALISGSALATVDCTVTVKDVSTVYRRVDLGAMVARFRLNVLTNGKLEERKMGANLSCNTNDEDPMTATICKVALVDMSELINMGSFSKGKTLSTYTFNAGIPQDVNLTLGDATGGEDTAKITCNVR